jgi:hypothetical protein
MSEVPWPKQAEAERRLADEIPRLTGRRARGLWGAAPVPAGTLGTITGARVVPALDPLNGRPWLAVDVAFDGGPEVRGLALWRKGRGDDIALGEVDPIDQYVRELAVRRARACLRMYEGALSAAGARVRE